MTSAENSPIPSPIVIAAGDYEATLSPLGAGLSALTLCGVDLVMPTDPTCEPPGYAGQTLLPWPNRLRDGHYTWAGGQYSLPCNDVGTHTALHGLVADKLWTVAIHEAAWAQFALTLAPSDAYPWELLCSVRYELDADLGLRVTVTASTTGESPAPYGVSQHPYLLPGQGTVDDWTLKAPARVVYSSDDQLIPVRASEVQETEHDYRSVVPMRGRSVDNCFAGLPDGPWTVTVANPSAGVATMMTSTARWLQMYSGDFIGRTGLAVEPMSCPPNAFASHVDVVALKRGDSHVFSYDIRGSLTRTT